VWPNISGVCGLRWIYHWLILFYGSSVWGDALIEQHRTSLSCCLKFEGSHINENNIKQVCHTAINLKVPTSNLLLYLNHSIYMLTVQVNDGSQFDPSERAHGMMTRTHYMEFDPLNVSGICSSNLYNIFPLVST
jgi:hypothetical protein